MSFKWRDYHVAKFLELYQAEDCLWNFKCENYENITLREKSYENMRVGMDIESLTLTDIKNKIKSIRTTYKVELNKVLKANKSGTGVEDLYKPKLFWFAQADQFSRGVSLPKESQSNLVLQQTQVEDDSELATQIPNLEVGANAEESDEPQEHLSHEVVTTSTSKDKAVAIKMKRLSPIATPQSPSKKKRKPENAIDDAIYKLQNIANECKEPNENKFDISCKSLAYQLTNMPLERALVCQEKLQSVMTKERLNQISISAHLQSRNSSACSMTIPNFANEQASSNQSLPYGNQQSSPSYQPSACGNEQSPPYENEQPSSYQSPPYDNEQGNEDILTKAIWSII